MSNPIPIPVCYACQMPLQYVIAGRAGEPLKIIVSAHACGSKSPIPDSPIVDRGEPPTDPPIESPTPNPTPEPKPTHGFYYVGPDGKMERLLENEAVAVADAAMQRALFKIKELNVMGELPGTGAKFSPKWKNSKEAIELFNRAQKMMNATECHGLPF